MATITASRAGPIRTAKTPKRVRFAGEDRDQTRLIRQQEAYKRDARNIPRVDVDVSTSYEIPALSAAAEALFGYAKSTLESAKSTLGNVVKSALTSSFTSSFGKINLSFNGDKDNLAPVQQQQASMLEYPPFLAGATPNVVKRNRRDYYQSIGVMTSMKKAKSYAPGSTPARTPDTMQSDKERNWYRFHETPYAGHKLDFGRGRSLTSLPPPSKPEYRFESPNRKAHKGKTPKSSAKKQQRSAMKNRSSKAKLGELIPRRSNSEEFHANFSGRERNELYASYTRFLTAIRFDVKQFAEDLRGFRLPTNTILKIHERMKRSDWDFFVRIMADEEYWGHVKGVGITKVPVVPDYIDPQPKRANVFPCEYCQSHEWAGKVEVREIENEGDEIPVHGRTKFDEPYTQEELAHIEAGRYFKVFHRFCHESRYDWKFPDPSRPCSWEGQNHPNVRDGDWSISKYDPRLRHFPLYMQKLPKRVRQIQQDLQDMVTLLSAQDRAAWLYIQGIRRYNTRMATLLEKMDMERKRRQVFWPCQMQVKVHIKSKPEREPEVVKILDEEPVESRNKRSHSPEVEEIRPDMNGASNKRPRFMIDKHATGEMALNGNYRKAYVEDAVDETQHKKSQENPEDDSRKRTRSGDDTETEDVHEHKRAHTRNGHHRTPPSSFGLFSEDEETEDDEQSERVREWERQRASKEKEKEKANEPASEPQKEQPKLTWIQKLDAAMKQREAELAAQEAENAKIEAEKAAAKQPTPPKQTDTGPSILADKPVFPPAPTTSLAPAPTKPFVFEDPTTTQEQTITTDEGRNPLKEHTNGVKPSAPAAAVPNLFSSAVPNLAPTGFNYGQNPSTSPLKPVGASTSTVFGTGKTGNVGLFGNEENIPTTSALAQAPAPAQAAPVPAAPAPSAPSIFAPKLPAPAAVESSSAVPSSGFFSSALASAPTAAATGGDNKTPFAFFPQKKDQPKGNIGLTAAPSVFSGLSAPPAPPAAPVQFLFGAKPAETGLAPSNLFSKADESAPSSNVFAKPAETTTNLFPKSAAQTTSNLFGVKPAEASTTNLFGKVLQPTTNNLFAKPAEPATTNFFGKPSDAATTSNLFGKSAAASATDAVSKSAAPAPISNLFGNVGGVSAAPATASATTTAPTFTMFGTSATAITTTGGSVTCVPATAPVEAPKSFLFGSNTTTVPKADFEAKPPAVTPFNFTGTAKPAAPTAGTFNFSAGGAKPAEPVAANLFSKPVATSAPSTGTTTSSIFTSGVTTTAAPAMTTSFPTFGGSSAVAPAIMSQSFPPTTPQAPPPPVIFGGFKPQDTPSKQSPGNRFNEDISMASPEQSPEKPSPKTGLFGAITNGMANGNAYTQNKSFFPATTAPPTISFGAPVSQPPMSIPTTTAPPASTFNFGQSTFSSVPSSIPGVPAPVSSMAPAPITTSAPTFQFNTANIDFNPNTPATRKTATPRGARRGRR